jgi:dihydrofolate reductase
MTFFNMIVAMCRENNGIGYQNQLPWVLQDDLKRFSVLTKGKGHGHNAMIMGRKTFESLPRILPGRVHLVLSRSHNEHEHEHEDENEQAHANVFFFSQIAQLIEFCQKQNFQSVWVIGGADVYQQFLQVNLIKTCYVTFIDKYFACDTYLPLPDLNTWRQIESIRTYDTTNACNVEYAVYSVAK